MELSSVMNVRVGCLVCWITNLLIPSAVASPPTFVLPKKGEWEDIEYIRQDTPRKIRCQATGDPDPSYEWTFNSSRIDGTVAGVSVNTATGDIQTLHTFSDQNNGFYRCMAKNDDGVIMTSPLSLINVRVDVFPKSGEEVESTFYGDYLYLPCNGVPYSQPPLKLSWAKSAFGPNTRYQTLKPDHREVMDPEGNLHFLWMERSDNNQNYSCRGSNEVINMEIHNTQHFVLVVHPMDKGERPPKVVYNKDVVTSEGDDARLVCLFSYFSTTDSLNITWYKHGEKVGSGRELILPAVENNDRDGGDYTCEATVGDTRSEAVVRHTVVGAPKFLANQSPLDTVVTFGSSAQFRCGTVSHLSFSRPPVWMVDGEPVLGCPPDRFQCGIKTSEGMPICVSMTTRCDGTEECPDGADEYLCGGSCQLGNGPSCNCSYPKFLCTDGSNCLQGNQKCDQKQDCHDLSDEAACETSSPVTVGNFNFNPTQTEMTINNVSYDDNMCVQCMVSNDYGTAFGQACLTVEDCAEYGGYIEYGKELEEILVENDQPNSEAPVTSSPSTVMPVPSSESWDETDTVSMGTDTVTHETQKKQGDPGTPEEKKQGDPGTPEGKLPTVAIILVCVAMLCIISILVLVLYQKKIICAESRGICRTRNPVTTPQSSFLDMYTGIEGTLTRYDQPPQSELQPTRDPVPCLDNPDEIGAFL